MNISSLKTLGGKILVVVVAVLIANEVQRQIDKKRAEM